MSESPASSTPYEVLGVRPSASYDELRRAYRRRLRETHPDTGGNPAGFHAVQLAWERIGEPELRAAYDRGSDLPTATSTARASGGSPFSAPRPAPGTSSLKARSYGHPGGQARERFLALIREWAGRGTDLGDPYEPSLVRSAPREVRALLAKAIAEESTARALSDLGMGFTVWNDVATREPGVKIDHVVLGPAGLYAVGSEDWGGPVRLFRGEIAGDVVPDGVQPVRELVRASRKLGKSLGVRFSGQVIVVPDGAIVAAPGIVDRGRNAGTVLIPRSRLAQLMRTGLLGGGSVTVGDVFEVRTRLQQGIRFV